MVDNRDHNEYVYDGEQQLQEQLHVSQVDHFDQVDQVQEQDHDYERRAVDDAAIPIIGAHASTTTIDNAHTLTLTDQEAAWKSSYGYLPFGLFEFVGAPNTIAVDASWAALADTGSRGQDVEEER